MKLTLEECKSLYFNSDALNEPPYKLRRMKRGGVRYYYDQNEKGKVTTFVSVTSMIKMTMPTSPFLIKWIAQMGEKEAKRFANERAEYGTLMHSIYGDLLIQGFFDLDLLNQTTHDWILEHDQLDFGLSESWQKELEKDILSFAQFIKDYNVRPLAIEVVLCHPRDGYAGAVDLVCRMDVPVKGDHGEVYKSGVNKGKPKMTTEPKEMICVVDFKSGKNGFYEDMEIQLESYKQMVELNFDIKVDRLFNFSPKAWRSEPGYNLKDQTDSASLVKLPHLVKLAKIENKRRVRPFTQIDGLVEPFKGVGKNFRQVDIEQLLKEEQATTLIDLIQVRGAGADRVLYLDDGDKIHTFPFPEGDITMKIKRLFLKTIKNVRGKNKKKN